MKHFVKKYSEVTANKWPCPVHEQVLPNRCTTATVGMACCHGRIKIHPGQIDTYNETKENNDEAITCYLCRAITSIELSILQVQSVDKNMTYKTRFIKYTVSTATSWLKIILC